MKHTTVGLLLLFAIGCREPYDGFKRDLANLKSSDPKSRASAASTLGDHGIKARKCLSALQDAMKDENPYVRVEAARAVWKIDPQQSAEVVPILAKEAGGEGIVQNDASLARNLAIKYLGDIGPEAKSAIPHLKIRLQGDNRYERVIAASAMTRIDKATFEIAIPILAEGLKHEDQFVRIEAAEALCKLGDDAKEFMPGVRKLLDDDDPLVRQRVGAALKARGRD